MDEHFNKILKFCLYRERCTSEVLEKLATADLDEDQVKRVMDKLYEERYLDDGRYTEIFVRNKFRIKKWGRRKIMIELKRKKIAPAMIAAALQTIDGDEYYQMMLRLAEKKWESLRAQDPKERIYKTKYFLASKGYEFDMMNDVIDELLKTGS